MLPNFICVGAQKSGTTLLFTVLKEHPDVYVPDRKEIHFFDVEERYLKGIEWYESNYFYRVEKEKAVGEITPSYMYLSHVPNRIRVNLGKDIKLIFMLRNPVERAYSHYWMSRRRGHENESFSQAIALEHERIQKGRFERLNFSYLGRGRYFEQIERYREHFPTTNMLFVIFEEFTRSSREQQRVFDFLKVKPYDLDSSARINPASMPRSNVLRDLVYGSGFFKSLTKSLGKLILPGERSKRTLRNCINKVNMVPFEKPAMSKDLKHKLLEEYYRDDMENLERLIGRSLDLWFV